MTLVTVLAGVLYGCFYYKKPLTFWRVLAAKFFVMLVCNVVLNTLCLSVLYGDGFFVLVGPRIIKNLIMWPIDSTVFFLITRLLETVGVIRILGERKKTTV